MRITYVLTASLIGLTIAIKTAEPAFLQSFENRVFDLYQQYLPRTYEPVPVRIVDIDDESLNKLGQWPWPRTLIAKMVQNLQDAGAATVAFDIVFAEPDRTSPKEVLKIWGLQDNLSVLLHDIPDADDTLAKVMANKPSVAGFVLTHGKNTTTPAKKAGIVVAGEDAAPFLPGFEGAVTSLPELENAATGNGSLNSDPDGDGILRRVPMMFRVGDQIYPSLASEALRTAQGASSYVIKTVGASGDAGGHGVTAIKIGNITVPTDARGNLWIYYSKYIPQRYIPVWRILDGSFDHDAVAGSIVLIGTSAAGLKDIRTTPLAPASSGVEVHAQAIEQAILGISLSRPDWIRGAEICLMVVSSLLMLVISNWLAPLWGAALMIAVMASAMWVSWYAFIFQRLLVEPVTSLLAVLLIYFSESLGRYMHGEDERKRIRHAFSHYMAPAMVEELARHPEKLKLGGESRMLSVMFCDIRGFTTISEHMNPVELTSLINSFMTPMTGAILNQHGTIDKYIGDCIMAFWNAPVSDHNHVQHAAQAALDMFKAVTVLNSARKEEAARSKHIYLPIHIGIGINSGECCVGNMGSAQRFNYSALGDEVNLASRLEGQCKTYGVDIVLGEGTVSGLDAMAVLELDLIKVKGKKEAKRIYTLLGGADVASDEPFLKLALIHNEMLESYRGFQWEKAAELAIACRETAQRIKTGSLDFLYDQYMERFEQLAQNPPARDWDGVFVAESK